MCHFSQFTKSFRTLFRVYTAQVVTRYPGYLLNESTSKYCHALTGCWLDLPSRPKILGRPLDLVGHQPRVFFHGKLYLYSCTNWIHVSCNLTTFGSSFCNRHNRIINLPIGSMYGMFIITCILWGRKLYTYRIVSCLAESAKHLC